MKDRISIFFSAAILLCAASAMAADSVRCNKCGSCARGADVYQFQDASEKIREFRFNFWPVKPMKAAEPVKKEDMLFQKMANGVKGMPDNIK